MGIGELIDAHILLRDGSRRPEEHQNRHLLTLLAWRASPVHQFPTLAACIYAVAQWVPRRLIITGDAAEAHLGELSSRLLGRQLEVFGFLVLIVDQDNSAVGLVDERRSDG